MADYTTCSCLKLTKLQYSKKSKSSYQNKGGITFVHGLPIPLKIIRNYLTFFLKSSNCDLLHFENFT